MILEHNETDHSFLLKVRFPPIKREESGLYNSIREIRELDTMYVKDLDDRTFLMNVMEYNPASKTLLVSLAQFT